MIGKKVSTLLLTAISLLVISSSFTVTSAFAFVSHTFGLTHTRSSRCSSLLSSPSSSSNQNLVTGSLLYPTARSSTKNLVLSKMTSDSNTEKESNQDSTAKATSGASENKQQPKVTIRLATENDLSTIYQFIQRKADFDRNMGSFDGTLGMTKDILKESLFPDTATTKEKESDDESATIISNARPYGFCLLSEIDTSTIPGSTSTSTSSSNDDNMVPAGFAIFYFRFSSFAGRPNLWMDDLFVTDQYRSLGIGKKIMNRLIDIANENRCTHVNWTADVRNDKALNFYINRMGGRIIGTDGHIHTVKLDL